MPFRRVKGQNYIIRNAASAAEFIYLGSSHGQCKLHEFFISINMILCLVLSVTSVLPVVQVNCLSVCLSVCLTV